MTSLYWVSPQGSVHSGWRLGSVSLTGPWLTWFQQAGLSTGPWMTWFQQAPLSSTQVCSDRCLTSGTVSSPPPQLLDICPRGLVMGPNWVIHYKVVLSSWRQLTSFSLWVVVGFLGIFILWGNILVFVAVVEIHAGCSFLISISLYFGFFC